MSAEAPTGDGLPRMALELFSELECALYDRRDHTWETGQAHRVMAVLRRALEVVPPTGDARAAVSPPLEWRCFHCDEVFTDKAEASEHFGEYPDDTPLCLVKGEDGGLAKRTRELEAELLDAYRQRNECENDARLWHEAEADRIRRIGHVQWWQELDSREGEKLVLLERIKELEAVSAPSRREPADLSAKIRALVARWMDQGEINSALKWRPNREWFNGNGEAQRMCARQLLALLPPEDRP